MDSKRRRTRWFKRRLLRDLATALAVALPIALLSLTPAMALLDGLFFDLVTRNEGGREPRVVIIEQDRRFREGGPENYKNLIIASQKQRFTSLAYRADPGVKSPHIPGISKGWLVLGEAGEHLPAQEGWRLAEAGPANAGVVRAINRVALSQYGIHREQFFGLPTPGGSVPMVETAAADRKPVTGAYLVRMPQRQNIPRIAASQLVDGVFKEGELAGLVALVEPGDGSRDLRLATALTPATHSTAMTLFSAHAVQTLLDHREVRVAPFWLAAIATILATLMAPFVLSPIRNKRYVVPLVLTGAIMLAVGALAMLQGLDVLLPLTAMIVGFLAASAAQMLRHEQAQDHYLAATLEQAINLSFGRSLFRDQSRLPEHLVTLAHLLGLPRLAVVGREAGERWQVLAQVGGAADDIVVETPQARARLDAARHADGPIAAGPLAPGWSETAHLAYLADAGTELAWLYEAPSGKAGAARARIAHTLTRSLRDFRKWQHIVLGGNDSGSRQASIDERVNSAARLITVQGEQIRQGLDALDTAVLVFHPVGFPIHANERMAALCADAGLALERVSIVEAIMGLTGIEDAQASLIVQRMLLRGGEMRVPITNLGARQFVLRIAAPANRTEQDVIALEAVDTSELDQLAELRLAVGTFIDRQLRNDLEAIGLGAKLARDPRLGADKLARIIDRIADVARRATARLEQVGELLNETPTASPSTSYPIEARKSVAQAQERVADLAASMGITIDAELPAISGFTVADPLMLTDMVEAVLRIVIADTAQGEQVKLLLEEEPDTTRIRVTGGFGMPFDRLVGALDAGPGEVPAEFQIAAAGFAEAIGWQGSVSYWSAAGQGYRFIIQLRRIG